MAWHGRPGRLTGFAVWFAVALVVASVLQWLQKYLPRTPALSDIGFNMLGFLLGWLGGMVSGNSLRRLAQRHLNLHGVDRFALVMLALWLAAELFPFIPTIDRSSVVDNVKSLWQQAAWQPRRMLLHAGMTLIGLEALAHLARSVAAERLVRPLAVVATLAMLGGKFVVINQAPGVPVVLGIEFGVFAAGFLTLALSDAAFDAEIFRAGIQSVGVGQTEAAASLGLTRWQTMRLVVLPQAIKRILPALGNQFVYVLKMSSLISVVGYQELTRRANELVLVEYRPLEIYTFLVVEYLILILLASWGVRWLERRMAT